MKEEKPVTLSTNPAWALFSKASGPSSPIGASIKFEKSVSRGLPSQAGDDPVKVEKQGSALPLLLSDQADDDSARMGKQGSTTPLLGGAGGMIQSGFKEAGSGAGRLAVPIPGGSLGESSQGEGGETRNTVDNSTKITFRATAANSQGDSCSHIASFFFFILASVRTEALMAPKAIAWEIIL